VDRDERSTLLIVADAAAPPRSDDEEGTETALREPARIIRCIVMLVL